MSALISLAMHEPDLARFEIDLAQTPHELRPPKHVCESTKRFANFTARDLRRLLVKTKIKLAH
jgi:hypothetical protein